MRRGTLKWCEGAGRAEREVHVQTARALPLYRRVGYMRVVVGTRYGDVAEAFDAVGLTEIFRPFVAAFEIQFGDGQVLCFQIGVRDNLATAVIADPPGVDAWRRAPPLVPLSSRGTLDTMTLRSRSAMRVASLPKRRV